MVLGTATTAISIALPILRFSHKAIEKVNKACDEKGLPPAFEIKLPDEEGSLEDIEVQGNPDYRFEGFGLDVGIPPQLSFWVHYKPGSPDHVEVGKILVPVRFSKVFDLSKILT